MASSAHTSPLQWPLYHHDEVHFVYEAPWWSRVVLLVDFALLLPLFIIVCDHRFHHVPHGVHNVQLTSRRHSSTTLCLGSTRSLPSCKKGNEKTAAP